MRWSSLNGNVFGRSSELIFQSYYQAHLVGSAYFEPVITYIPEPYAPAAIWMPPGKPLCETPFSFEQWMRNEHPAVMLIKREHPN